MKLRGRIAIVTGGGRGIGEAIAVAFAREGAHLVLAARTVSELRQAAERVEGLGATAQIVPADVANRRDAVRIVEAALARYGQVDILVNAAGFHGGIGRLWEVDAQEWRRAVEVNLFGTFFSCRAVLPHMIARRRGWIINFSGGGATSPLPRFTAYAVSKAAIVRLTETLAEEVSGYNIRVNAIAPGMVDTRLQDAVLAAGERAGDLLAQVRRLRETGEGGVPREVPAELAVFLASAASNGLTGKLIAAAHDGWQFWDDERVEKIMGLPWFTLRRLDRVTLRPLVQPASGDVTVADA